MERPMPPRTILLVDDVQFFLNQEKTFFDREEFNLLLARSGTEALEIVRQEKPDLIFMDLFMPEMDGDACCYAIKSDPQLKHIPVIMVTGGGNEADFERCWQAGCDDIVVKPINKIYFIAVTRKFLQLTFRKIPRFEARIRIQFQQGDEAEKVLTDYSVNLSTGGVFIETENILPLDAILRVEFMLPGRAQPIRCMSRVAWVNQPDNRIHQNLPGGMGLQFLNLSWDEMQAIRQFIQKEGLSPSW